METIRADFTSIRRHRAPGCPQNIAGFPVIVRLTKDNFNFAQANAGGTDIRFSRSDTIRLPYEIERWDPVAGLAEVWVRVDSIYGNDSTQFITMYWGNAHATDSSSGAAVFDTSNGFIGVWHMNEDPSTGAVSIKDRTVNAHDATPFGSMTAANSIEGATGKALSFNGNDDYLNAGNVSVPGTYSIGLWVLLDTIGDYERFIFKDSSYTLVVRQGLGQRPDGTHEHNHLVEGASAGWRNARAHDDGNVVLPDRDL
jgi:hypothetical protein